MSNKSVPTLPFALGDGLFSPEYLSSIDNSFMAREFRKAMRRVTFITDTCFTDNPSLPLSTDGAFSSCNRNMIYQQADGKALEGSTRFYHVDRDRERIIALVSEAAESALLRDQVAVNKKISQLKAEMSQRQREIDKLQEFGIKGRQIAIAQENIMNLVDEFSR